MPMGVASQVGVVVSDSVSGDWTGTNKASFTFGTGSITQSTTNDIMIYGSKVFSGDFAFEFVPNYAVTDTICVGMVESAETGNLNEAGASGYSTSLTNGTWFSLWADKAYIRNSGLVDDASGGWSWSSSDTIKMTRVGSTIKAYINGTLTHTFSQTTANDMVLMRGGGNQLGVGYATTGFRYAEGGDFP